jgi:dihydrodipicolinate synthase/N-acetylneuraminate lyase
MFANTSDWRFDMPGRNYYVQFIDRAMRGDLDQDFYEAHIRPVKNVSDKWWGRTVQKFGGALPVPLCKYWGELMGMAGGHVRAPHGNLSDEDKEELRNDLEGIL